MTITTRIHTFLKGQLVGTDERGNRYYQSRKASANGKHKRWVLYGGEKEPTTVPPQWHGWLHYITDTVPQERYDWQSDSIANPTGTDQAYFPQGSKYVGGQRQKATADYEAWKP